MKVAFVTLCLLVVCSTPVYSRIRNCGSTAKFNIPDIKVTGCTAGKRSCIFKRGEKVKLELPFTPTTDVTSLKTVVHGIIAGIPIPFPFPQPNACIGSNLNCPLTHGELDTYEAHLPILKSYPPISLQVKWQLVDQQGKSVVCLKMPVTLS